MKLNHLSFCLGFISLFILSSAPVRAQQGPLIENGEQKMITLHSAVFKDDRQIIIYTPPSYSTTHEACPVLYLLDPDNHFNLVAEYTRYLSKGNVHSMPPVIVVGIVHKDRMYELTPSQTRYNYEGKLDTGANSNYKHSGGNAQLFEYFKQEVIPYINKNYRTQPYRIFAGHSLGALTVVNALLNYPEMFNAYIAVSPSFWWDRKALLQSAATKLQADVVGKKVLFYSDGNEGSAPGSSFHTDVMRFDTLIKQNTAKRLRAAYVYYPQESHMTVPVKSYYDGLQLIFGGWDLPEISNKDVNRNVIMAHYHKLSDRFGYPILPNQQYMKGWGEWLFNNPATRSNGLSLLEMNADNNPQSSTAFESLGAAYVTLGQTGKAITAYKRAVALNPQSANAQQQLQRLTKHSLSPPAL